MSRYYELYVEFVGIDLKDVRKVVIEEFGWEEEESGEDYLVCRGSLYGGTSEEEAHKEIYEAIKKIKPFCRIKTRWTYLENLPHEEYGDDLDIDELQKIMIEKLNKIKEDKKTKWKQKKKLMITTKL